METTSDPAAALRVAERAAAAPYVDYPPSPAWYPLAGGLWAAMMVVGLDASLRDQVWGYPLLGAAIGLEFWYLAWYRSHKGVMPAMSGAPEPVGSLMTRFYVAFAGLFAIVVLVGLIVGWPVSAAVAALLTGAGLAWYERLYAGAAAELRRRVA